MWQIKKSAQPVHTRLISSENGEVEITNRYLFTNLSNLDAVWMLHADSEIIQKGVLDLNILPQKKAIVKVPYSKPDLKNGIEYRLLLSYRQKGKTLWANPGFEIAWDQMDLPWYKPATESDEVTDSPVEIEENEQNLIIKGKNFIYSFDKKSGLLIKIQVSGKELIKQGPELNVWHAPLAKETDEWTYGSSNIKNRIDGFGRMAATEWYSAGIDSMTYFPDNFSWGKSGNNSVVVNVKGVYITGNQRGSFINISRYTVDDKGKIVLENSIVPNGQMPAWLPRIGQQWIFDKSLNQVFWYGRGPQENYPDRKSGYRIGEYKSTVADMYEPYLIPQDYGLRTDNRRITITDTNGFGLEIKGDRLFNFSAQPYSTDNLTKALYTYQLHPFNGVTFNLDYATSGVGCTAAGVFPEYQVMPQRYDFKVTIRPVLPPTP
jgi:beta-galactosidase